MDEFVPAELELIKKCVVGVCCVWARSAGTSRAVLVMAARNAIIPIISDDGN